MRFTSKLVENYVPLFFSILTKGHSGWQLCDTENPHVTSFSELLHWNFFLNVVLGSTFEQSHWTDRSTAITHLFYQTSVPKKQLHDSVFWKDLVEAYCTTGTGLRQYLNMKHVLLRNKYLHLSRLKCYITKYKIWHDKFHWNNVFWGPVKQITKQFLICTLNTNILLVDLISIDDKSSSGENYSIKCLWSENIKWIWKIP